MKEDLLQSLRHAHVRDSFVGDHPSFLALVEKLTKLAPLKVAVLLIGETGTGKGRCAEFLHQYSDRYRGPFIPFNCGAGPETLFESQLFGHVKGAFTGAHRERPGLVEEAHTGVLFLDEVNSLQRTMQVKLNHFLENGCFRRLGENRFRKSDVRIIAASNDDLCGEVREGRFREDLYYRLAEYELHVPPLRERREDIVLLIDHFIQNNAHLSSNGKITFTRKAIKELQEFEWRGNIRELENFVKRCIIDTSSGVVGLLPLPKSEEAPLAAENESLQALPWREAKRQVVSLFERNYIQGLLERYRGIVARCRRSSGE